MRRPSSRESFIGTGLVLVGVFLGYGICRALQPVPVVLTPVEKARIERERAEVRR